MSSLELKNQILEIFQRNRQTPQSPFDESHFLDYLLSPPATKNNIKNSFKGVSRYYRFFEDVELTFGICFSLSDQDRFYSINQFVKKTKERIGKDRGNKMILDRRLQEKDHYYIEVVMTIILVTLIYFLKIHIITILFGIIYVIVVIWMVRNKLRNKRHNKRLLHRLTN